MTKIYDCLIIGGGPAGLSTALALARVHRTCAVFSNAKYRNEGATAHSILTRDHTPSRDLLAYGRKDIEKYGNTNFVETTIARVFKREITDHDEFVASNTSGQEWQGRTVVMATGVKDIFPDLPGYADNWPHNIYQCLFCDGHERSGLPVGVLCYPVFNPMMTKMATMAHFISMLPGSKSNGTSAVTLFTNGVVDEGDEVNKTALETCAAHGIKVEHRLVVKLEKVTDEAGVYVHVKSHDDNSTTRIFVAFIVHKPPTDIAAQDLVQQLGLETEAGMFGKNIKTQAPFQGTNVPGVFACGDAGVAITHVTNAMLTGNGCGAGVAHYCCALDDKVALVAYGGERAADMRLVNGLANETGCIEDTGIVRG